MFRNQQHLLWQKIDILSAAKLKDILENNAKYTLAYNGCCFEWVEVEPWSLDSDYLGSYLNEATLVAAHPTATVDNFAIVQATNSIRRRDGSAWIDTGSTVNVPPSEKLTVTTNWQTTFTLTFPVDLPWASTRLYVNGQKANYGAQYTFNTDTELERQDVWYTLETTDTLEFYYI